VRPALVEMPAQRGQSRHETFAPILYVFALPRAGRGDPLHNAVAQGLSSIFTQDLREAERFISAEGSDCGIANVNLGRAAPRSAARSAARRRPAADASPGSDAGGPTCGATNTINYSTDLPLAQGVRFDVE
jgi:aldehyde dehydrogenase (NAD+)